MLISDQIIESPSDLIMQEDLNTLAHGDFPIESIKDSTFFITGATGLIGSQIVKLLACFNRVRSANIKIIASVRSEKKAQRVFGDLLKRGDLSLCIGDINNTISCDRDIDYVIHGASATSSRYFVTNPVETIITAICGTKNVLDLAYEKKVKGFIYLSSLEVYGTPSSQGFITEADYGYIDPLSVRSSYSEGKRMVECLCVSFGKEYDIPVKIARLSQTFGAGVEYDDGRVFAEFARCAIEKRNIVLHTAGNTVRSYCYSADALLAILYILAKGSVGEAYNVTNMDTIISIKDMAKLVCDIFSDSHISVEFDIPEDVSLYGFNPEMVIKLDSSKLIKLGWKPAYTLEDMFIRLVNSMKEKKLN